MELIFKHVVPHTLDNETTQNGSIWGKIVHFSKGEHILLAANSGSGKTTFTHIVAGIHRKYEGSVLMDNIDCTSFTSTDWAEIRSKKISIVFQDLQLFDSLTVIENLLLKHQLSPVFSKKEIHDMLEELQLSPHKNKKCEQLSWGQKQRVAILRALCQPFEWLVLDEPFSHLDETNTQLAFSLILRRVKQQNAGLILTSLSAENSYPFDKKMIL